MMRTTITLDDDAADLLQDQMRRRGVGLKAAVNEAIRAGLGTAKREAYRIPVFDMGPPKVDLDRASELAADLKDQELIGKLELGK